MLEGMGVEGMQGEGSLDILPRKENVGERAGLARLALLGEREADLGEEALDRRRRGRAAQVLPRHGGEVGEDVLVPRSPLTTSKRAPLVRVLDLRKLVILNQLRSGGGKQSRRISSHGKGFMFRQDCC